MNHISNLSLRIFVGGLNQDVDEPDLEKAFKLFGEITNVVVMRDRENGRSKGYAFISFKNPQSCEEAISRMHGVEIRGKCVSVRHAERAKHLNYPPHRQGIDVDRFKGGRAGPALMHSPLPYRGGSNFRPSDRVFVTQDEEQGSRNIHRPRSPIDLRARRYQDSSPTTHANATGEHFSQRREDAAGEGSGYYGPHRQFASEDYRGQPRSNYNYRSRTEQELSPAREINAYINSRGRSYSPLLQLGQKLIASARSTGTDDYDRSPIRSDSRHNLHQNHFSYSDRSKTSERGSHRSFLSSETRDRRHGGALPKHHTEYRSRSPMSTIAYQRPSSPDSTYRPARRGDSFAKNFSDGSAKRYSTRKDQRRSSPVSGRGDVGIRQRIGPPQSGMRDTKWGRSQVGNERLSAPRRSPHRGRAVRGDLESRFSQGVDSRGTNDYGHDSGHQRGENTSSRRDSLDKPGPSSGGKGFSFDDRGSYKSKPIQYSQERQTGTNSSLRNRDRSPRGSWNKFQHRESNGNCIPARNSPPRRGRSIGDTPRSVIERGREELRSPRDRAPHRQPQSGNRRY